MNCLNLNVGRSDQHVKALVCQRQLQQRADARSHQGWLLDARVCCPLPTGHALLSRDMPLELTGVAAVAAINHQARLPRAHQRTARPQAVHRGNACPCPRVALTPAAWVFPRVGAETLQ